MVFGWFRPKFSALKEKADKAFAQKDFAEAMRLYEQALSRADKEPEAERAKVEARLAESKDALARSRLDEARTLFEQDLLDEAEDLAQIARDRAHDPKLREEAETFLKQIEARKEEGPAIEEEGEGEEEDEEIALEERFEMYAERAPEEIRARYAELGESFRELVLEAREGDPEKALPGLDALAETELPARFERAICRLALEQLDGALEDLEKVIASVEPDRDLYRFTAEAYLARATKKGARAPTRLTPRARAEEEAPHSVPEEAKGDLSRASEYIKSALELAPHDAELYRALIELSLIQGDVEGARRAAQAGLKRILTPDLQRTILTGLGRAEAFAGAWETAEDILGQAVRISRGLDPERKVVRIDREAAWLLARILIDQGRRLEDALDLVRALLMHEQEAERPALLLSEGEILGKMGQKEAARERFLAARALVPDGSKDASRIEAAQKELEESSR